jgi:Tat protein translocase TatB subunit
VLNVGTPEMLVILVVALLVLGPNKLPEVARQVGKAVGEIRRLGAGFQAEIRDAMQEPVKMEPVEPDPPESEPMPEPEPTPEPEAVAPGWSPDAEAETTVVPPVVDGTEAPALVDEDDEPPAGIAPV